MNLKNSPHHFCNGKAHNVDSCESTQELALNQALKTAQANKTTICWVSAQSQSKGRGRQSSSWENSQGSLLASASFKIQDQASLNLALFPLLCGQSLYQSARDFVPQEDPIALKWPNDLLRVHGNKIEKIGGILCELKKSCLIAGWGVNLNHAPIDKISHATSLRASQEFIDSELFFKTLQKYFLENINNFFHNPELYQKSLIEKLNTDSMSLVWNKKILYNKESWAYARRLDNQGQLEVDFIKEDGSLRKQHLCSGEILLHSIYI